MKRLIMLVSIILPWTLRRWLLRAVFGYQIDPTARIGLAWVLPKKLIMERNSKIDHFTVCKGMDLISLSEYASVGRANWITAFPKDLTDHFQHQKDRQPALVVGAHAAITSRHLIDCTDTVEIGEFSILAGFRSQILTHSIDMKESIQSCAKVSIGRYCFVGTNSVLLSGSSLPDFSILGAQSLLNRQYSETYTLYAGVPAKAVKTLDKSDRYFSRTKGFVV
jgi:serine acetyltransferase